MLRIFGGERITGIMERLGMEDGEPIAHNLISRAIENAQSKVEGHNFDIRKHLIEYDDVMNQQREVIYKQRREILTGTNLKSTIEDIILELSENAAQEYSDERARPEEWDFDGLRQTIFKQFNFHFNTINKETLESLNSEGLAQLIFDQAKKRYQDKEMTFGSEHLRHLEQLVMLQTVDNLWKDHLLSMDHLKEGIGLRGYAQQNPLLIYKKEGFDMFADMIERIKEDTISILFRIELAKPEEMESLERPQQQDLVFLGSGDGQNQKKSPSKRSETKVGRNSPCPCGSGKKYKKCCGQ